jgi:hypothetical protein
VADQGTARTQDETPALTFLYYTKHSTLSGPAPLSHAAAASTLSAGLRSLAGESVPPESWSLVGVDPAASVAVYRVAAR